MSALSTPVRLVLLVVALLIFAPIILALLGTVVKLAIDVAVIAAIVFGVTALYRVLAGRRNA